MLGPEVRAEVEPGQRCGIHAWVWPVFRRNWVPNLRRAGREWPARRAGQVHPGFASGLIQVATVMEPPVMIHLSPPCEGET